MSSPRDLLASSSDPARPVEDDDVSASGELRFRAIFLSDTHLGTPGCQAGPLLAFLRHTESDYLFLVGDIIDGWQLKRRWFWHQTHNDVVQKVLRKARKGTRVVYVPGNHDEAARHYVGVDFGGIAIRHEATHVTANGERLLITHGDLFDGVVRRARWLAFLGDSLYTFTLKLNQHFNAGRARLGMPYWSLSQFLQHKVKNAVSYITAFEEAVAREARGRGFDGVVCGHIHQAEIRQIGDIMYCNSGDWVESLTALVEAHDGTITPDGFRTIPCPTYPEIRLALFPGRRVARMIDSFAPDAVHIATEAPLGLAARRHCLRTRRPFTTAYHTQFPEYIHARTRLPVAIVYRWMRWFHGPATALMVGTPELRQRLADRGFANLAMWSRGVDTTLFRDGERGVRGAPRPIFLYAGRVSVEKNIESFLALKLPGTKWVVDDGPARAELERRFPDARFFGMKIGDELAWRYRQADPVGAVAGVPIVAPLDGSLRGLATRGARVSAGAVLVEIDPRRSVPLLRHRATRRHYRCRRLRRARERMLDATSRESARRAAEAH